MKQIRIHNIIITVMCVLSKCNMNCNLEWMNSNKPVLSAFIWQCMDLSFFFLIFMQELWHSPIFSSKSKVMMQWVKTGIKSSYHWSALQSVFKMLCCLQYFSLVLVYISLLLTSGWFLAELSGRPAPRPTSGSPPLPGVQPESPGGPAGVRKRETISKYLRSTVRI